MGRGFSTRREKRDSVCVCVSERGWRVSVWLVNPV